jgi:hypothetical protein
MIATPALWNAAFGGPSQEDSTGQVFKVLDLGNSILEFFSDFEIRISSLAETSQYFESYFGIVWVRH